MYKCIYFNCLVSKIQAVLSSGLNGAACLKNMIVPGVHENSRESLSSAVVSGASVAALRGSGGALYSEVTVVPVATAGACNPPCTTIFPFLVLLFFMTFVVAVTQMPLLMIVLR